MTRISTLLTAERLIGALILALVLMGAAVLVLRGGAIAYPDEEQYLAIARNLLSLGVFSVNGVEPTAYRLPAYPLLIAGVLAVVQSVVAVKAVQVALWLASGVMLAVLAARLNGARAAVLLLALFALYPASLYTATTLYPQTVMGFAFAASLLLVLRPGPVRLGSVALLAILGSFATLCVANYAVAYVVHLGVAVANMERRRRWQGAVIGVVLFALPLGVWLYRNATVFGEPLFSTNSGVNLLLGNSPRATAHSGVDNPDFYDELARLEGSPEPVQDRKLKQIAIDWMAQHPREALVLFIQKFAHWFAATNDLRVDSEATPWRNIAAFVTYYGLLAAALSGTLIAAMRRRLSLSLLLATWGTYLLVGLSYAVFFTRVRFRIPFDPALMLIAAHGLGMLLERDRLGRQLTGWPASTPLGPNPAAGEGGVASTAR